VIIANAIVMALIWYRMPNSLERATDILNYVFTLCFVLEMAFKLVGLGLRGYASQGMNLFDAVVTVAGVVEMSIALSPASSASYLSVLRAFRLLRVFRLARSWTSLHRIITVLLSSILSVSWLSVLLLLFMFITALLATQVCATVVLLQDIVVSA
jgi:hypothetical protein